MWVTFSSIRARASSSLTKVFRVPLKGLFVMDTFTSDNGSSCRQLLTASATSSSPVVGSMSMTSTLTVRTRWRTDSLPPTTFLKAESNLFLSFAEHFTSTRTPFDLVSLIPPIVTPNSSWFTQFFRLFKIAAQLTPSEGLINTVSEWARFVRSVLLISRLGFFFFRKSFLAGTSTHSSDCFEVFGLFCSGLSAAVTSGLRAGSLSHLRVSEGALDAGFRGFACLLPQRPSFLANLPLLSFAASCLWDSTRSQRGKNRSTPLLFMNSLSLREPPQSHPWWTGKCSFWSWKSFPSSLGLQHHQLLLMPIMEPLPMLSSLGFHKHNIHRVLHHIQFFTKQLLQIRSLNYCSRD